MSSVDMKMPILIVDDYKTMLRIIRNLLKQLGFDNVDEAMDGAQALQKLRNNDLQLVQKPEVLITAPWEKFDEAGMLTDNQLKAVPFIMVTAESKTENVVAAKQAGVSNYIVKPFNAATLKTKLSAVLGNF